MSNTLSSENQSSDYDVVIVGGGTVGCCMALAIARLINKEPPRKLRVAIIEAKAYDSNLPHPGFDGRAIALARQSLDFLSQLGLSSQIVGSQINNVTEAIRYIHVSDQGFLGQCDLDAKSLQVPELGRVIELHEFGRILHQALSGNAHEQNMLDWFCPDSVTQIDNHSDYVHIVTESGKQIKTKLLLVTDGGESGTRELLSVPAEVHDYQQVALITNVQTDKPHQQQAFERFTENGPLAFLPMTDNRCSVVWTLPKDDYQALIEVDETEFCRRLQNAFGYRLGTITKVGERIVYPLRLVRAQSHYLHRTALLGNAAQTLHPIAGQGFNLGLRDVQDMVQCIHNALQFAQSKQENADIGSYQLLSEFRRLRQQDADTTIGATHGLVNLFSNRALPLVMARNLGLMSMQLAPIVKTAFAQRAMGRR